MNSQPFFIQINEELAVNTMHIQAVHFTEHGGIRLVMTNTNDIFLYNNEVATFKQWWTQGALVYRPEKGE